jgi:uncharacterized membrane protein YfcA
LPGIYECSHLKSVANQSLEQDDALSKFSLAGTATVTEDLTVLNSLEFSGLICLVAGGAGFLGALTGLGGGVVLTPALTLLFGVDIHYAIGATLVSVIATSSGAASAYLKEGYSNIRIGMFLEIATTVGAILGASLSSRIPSSGLGLILGVVLLYSAYLSTRPHPDGGKTASEDPLARRLKLDSGYPTPHGWQEYRVQRVKTGFGIMFGAGTLSGLLGIGSGAFKVIAMDQAMRIPFKVSTTTSNFMIGVTAAAGAGVYLSRGYIDPALAMPVMLGVSVGAFLGARHLSGAEVRVLRVVFALVVGLLALEMIYNGLFGKL